jgi:hypothetical protein
VRNRSFNSRNGGRLMMPDGPRRMNMFSSVGDVQSMGLYVKCVALATSHAQPLLQIPLGGSGNRWPGFCVGRLGVCAWARLGCHLSAVATVAGAACRACRRMRLGGHPCMWPPLQAGKLRSSFCWSMCVNCPLHKDPPFRSTPALTPCTPPAAQLTPARCRVHAFTHAPPLQPLPIRHRVGFAAHAVGCSSQHECHATPCAVGRHLVRFNRRCWRAAVALR